MMPQPSGNLGDALMRWNQFLTAPQQTPPPQSAGSSQPSQLQTPQAPSWALANANQGMDTKQGTVQQPSSSPNPAAGQAAGALAGGGGGGGIGGLLSSI